MKQSRGFTLVEMLVTLVVGGLVITLLWQALGQVALLELRLADARVLSDRDALRRAWVSQALAGVMTGTLEDPNRLRGGPKELSALSTMPPWPGSSGPDWMALTLQVEPGASTPTVTTTLTAVQLLPDPGSATGTLRPLGEPAPLWRWEGEGRLDYLDRSGFWHEQWPPAAGTAEPLPRAVRLQGAPGGALLVPLVATQLPLIGRRGLLQSDEPR